MSGEMSQSSEDHEGDWKVWTTIRQRRMAVGVLRLPRRELVRCMPAGAASVHGWFAENSGNGRNWRCPPPLTLAPKTPSPYTATMVGLQHPCLPTQDAHKRV